MDDLLRDCALKIEHYAADRETRGLSTEHEAALLARIQQRLDTGGWTEITGQLAPVNTRWINKGDTNLGFIKLGSTVHGNRIYIHDLPDLPKEK